MEEKFNVWGIFKRQLNNPLLLILFSATAVSFVFGQKIQAIVIFGMIAMSVSLGFWNEYKAEKTMADLLKKISFTALIIRDGIKQAVPVKEITTTDRVILYPGAVVPADLKLIQANRLEINEAVVSGESLPVHKDLENNLTYMGTIVNSGTGIGKVLSTGIKTKFGHISASISSVKPETEFQKGLKGYGKLLFRLITIMGGIIFLMNWLLGRPVLEAALFALSVAIGLTPELLPVVVTVSLAHGANRLAKKEVVVKQLVAIEDLGNMEVLCCDKTGTLTEGRLRVNSHQNANGQEDNEVLRLALICNSAVIHHKVIGDAIDSAIWEYANQRGFSLSKDIQKISEQPFDYEHRGMFTVIADKDKREYIFKGAPDQILKGLKNNQVRIKNQNKIDEWYKQGYRVMGIAKKSVTMSERYTFSDAKEMELAGWILFADLPKPGVKKSLDRLEKMGVKLKIISGDNELITARICEMVGVPCRKVITGPEMLKMSEEELLKHVWEVDVFARMTPDQKLRIIKALKSGEHTVGYIGDGVNDVPALHEADAGISVDSAVDVAKDTASIVLLKKTLDAVADGIEEGRRTFANTMKYILMGTSSNFGNMFSMAGASFIFPFLPMTPTQILLANSMYDISQLTIPTDKADKEELVRPNKWNLKLISRYMLFFGPISSVYDFLTFGVMYLMFKARGSLFQTGWFVESLVTEILVIFVIRTNKKPFWKSRPSWQVVMTCGGITLIGMGLPYFPIAHIFNFSPLPPLYFLVLIIMTVTYLQIVESVKRIIIHPVEKDGV